RVHDDLERGERGAIDVGEEMLDVGRLDIRARDRALPWRRRKLVSLGERLDVLQAGVGAERPRALADALHAVVVRRIVARGDHDAAVELAAERREVDDLRADYADVEHVDA